MSVTSKLKDKDVVEKIDHISDAVSAISALMIGKTPSVQILTMLQVCISSAGRFAFVISSYPCFLCFWFCLPSLPIIGTRPCITRLTISAMSLHVCTCRTSREFRSTSSISTPCIVFLRMWRRGKCIGRKPTLPYKRIRGFYHSVLLWLHQPQHIYWKQDSLLIFAQILGIDQKALVDAR